MKDVLILGGTRFVGKKLVSLLLTKGYRVTIGTRGTTPDSFDGSVKRLTLDRADFQSLEEAVGSSEWDIVYDQICYTPESASYACRLFENKAERYIVTSSQSVYDFLDKELSESDFDPYSYSVTGHGNDLSYSEGKRLVEAVLFQQAKFPVCAVRFPIILGTDDYTKRLQFHIERIRDGIPIGVPNMDARISFIDSDEAASFLVWLGDQDLQGPINACSSGSISIRELLAAIEQEVGKEAQTLEQSEEQNCSPFGIPSSWHMTNGRAEQAGYQFRSLNSWLPKLIRELCSF